MLEGVKGMMLIDENEKEFFSKKCLDTESPIGESRRDRDNDRMLGQATQTRHSRYYMYSGSKSRAMSYLSTPQSNHQVVRCHL